MGPSPPLDSANMDDSANLAILAQIYPRIVPTLVNSGSIPPLDSEAHDNFSQFGTLARLDCDKFANKSRLNLCNTPHMRIRVRGPPIITQKSSQNHPKIIPKSSQNYPKITPTLFRNDSKITPKLTQHYPTIIPKLP